MRSRPGGSKIGKPSAFEQGLPPGLRQRLENARLDLRALFRAADQLFLAQRISPELNHLFELDADFAEVLHLMDLAPQGIDVKAMLRDTEASFRAVPDARAAFLADLGTPQRKILDFEASIVRAALPLKDAYIDIPGRDPNAGQ
jgi:hypothetical protein